MSRKKMTLISRILWAFGMCFGIWLISIMPTDILNTISMISFLICVVVLVGGFGFLYFKRLRHMLVLFIAMLCLPSLVMAEEEDQCAPLYKESVERGDWCAYQMTEKAEGDGLCSYMKKFNPSRKMSARDLEKHRVKVNSADAIVESYEALTDNYKASVDGFGQCILVDSTQGRSVAERRKELVKNNSKLCCAMALQTLDQMYTGGNAERKVETVPMMLADEKMQCWACDVVYLLIVLGNSMAYRVAPAVSMVAMLFLGIAFAVWILVKVGMLILNRDMSGKEYAGPQFFKDLFARSMWVGIVALILVDTANLFDPTAKTKADLNKSAGNTLLNAVYTDVMSPVLELISGLAIELSDSLTGNAPNFYQEVMKAAEKTDPVSAAAMKKMDYCSTDKDPSSSAVGIALKRASPALSKAIDSQVISKDLARNLLCITQLPVRGVAPISAAGSLFTSYSITNARILRLGIINPRIPRILYLLYGIALLIGCWYLGLIVALNLIDIMVRIALVIMLCPIYIALAAFPITRDKYAKPAWDFFLRAIMGFVQVSMAVGLVVPFFYKAITSSGSEAKLIKAMAAPSSSSYVPNLYDEFTQNGFMLIIYIMGACWLGGYLLKATGKFFEELGFGSVVAGGGTMGAALDSARQAVGDTADFAKGVKERSNAFSKPKKKADTGASSKSKSSQPSANRRAWEDFKKNTKVGRGITATNRAYGQLKNKTKDKIDRAKQWVGNRKTVQKVVNAYRKTRDGVKHVKDWTKRKYQGFKTWKNDKYQDLKNWKNRNVAHAKQWVGSRKVVQKSVNAYRKTRQGVRDFKDWAKNRSWAARRYRGARRVVRNVRDWGRRNYQGFKTWRNDKYQDFKIWKNDKVARMKEWGASRKIVQKSVNAYKKTREGIREFKDWAKNRSWAARQYRGAQRVARNVRDWGRRTGQEIKQRVKNSWVGRRYQNVKDFKDATVRFAKNNMLMRGLGHTINFVRDNKLVRGARIIRGAMEEAKESDVGRAVNFAVNNKTTRFLANKGRFLANNKVTRFAVDQAKKGTKDFFHPEG